jgi:hypothetical protein
MIGLGGDREWQMLFAQSLSYKCLIDLVGVICSARDRNPGRL